MQILHKLRATSSRLEKENILRSATQKDKSIFKFAYDPDLMYYQRFDYINYNSVKDLNDEEHGLLLDILNELANRDVTGNLAREMVEDFVKRTGNHIIRLICNKDLDCGVSVKTLNNVFGKKFIPDFQVQLAKEVPIEQMPLPCIAQIKYDGVRVLAKTGKNGWLKTRNGNMFEYPKLEKYLKEINREILLDGELILQGTNHTGASGPVNSAIRGNPICIDMNYVLFDAMPYEIFKDQRGGVSYINRAKYLRDIVLDLFGAFPDSQKLISLAQTWECSTHKEINEIFQSVLLAGGEGIIVKTWQHHYTYKRSKDWMKLKAIKDCDIFCHSYNEGTGKYEGMIGALNCIGKVEGKDIRVSIGTGLSDADRALNPDLYLNKTIKVLYNSVIFDSKNNEWSLFLPRFVTIREDK